MKHVYNWWIIVPCKNRTEMTGEMKPIFTRLMYTYKPTYKPEKLGPANNARALENNADTLCVTNGITVSSGLWRSRAFYSSSSIPRSDRESTIAHCARIHSIATVYHWSNEPSEDYRITSLRFLSLIEAELAEMREINDVFEFIR